MFDIYEAITNRIIDALEAGTIPWRKPWKGGCRYAISHSTGKPYSLLNQLMLGERPGEYLTWKQIHDEGGRVKKGAKAVLRATCDPSVRLLIIGGASALMGSMLCGMADYIWNYPRVMLVFWFVCAIVVAGIRLAGREESDIPA